MAATAANLIERVLPSTTPLRQWVLTFPFPWRPRLAQDCELLGRLTRIFVDSAKPPLYIVPKSFSDVSAKASPAPESASQGTAPHLNADRESRPAGSLRR
jgi:hypothetical protein